MSNANEHNDDTLTATQTSELRRLFEPKYKRHLTDDELFEIHFNLKNLMSVIASFEDSQSTSLTTTTKCKMITSKLPTGI